MSDNSIEGAALRRVRLFSLLLTSAIAFSGCGEAQEPVAKKTPKLPSVTEYSIETTSYAPVTKAFSDTTPSELPPVNDSETVYSKDAASSQTEQETAEIQETTVSEAVTTETSAETVTEVSETSAPVTSQLLASASSDTAVSTNSETTVQSAETLEMETECYVPAASSPVASVEYDSEFFSSDLFIGDSISTGYSLYGFLDDKNVYAKVGLNPSTVLTKTVATCYGEIGISTMLAYTTPKRVYIMLGSNGIQWLSVGNMLQSTDTLVELIKESCPDCNIVIVSVPPVTADYDSTVEDVNVMAKINEYNASLNAYCTSNKMLFVDAASILKDETGYFNSTYAESDGMHFKSSAYKTLLSKIQTDVTGFEKLNLPKTAETEVSESETTESETISETDVCDESTETSSVLTEKDVQETFLTLPEDVTTPAAHSADENDD